MTKLKWVEEKHPDKINTIMSVEDFYNLNEACCYVSFLGHHGFFLDDIEPDGDNSYSISGSEDYVGVSSDHEIIYLGRNWGLHNSPTVTMTMDEFKEMISLLNDQSKAIQGFPVAFSGMRQEIDKAKSRLAALEKQVRQDAEAVPQLVAALRDLHDLVAGDAEPGQDWAEVVARVRELLEKYETE